MNTSVTLTDDEQFFYDNAGWGYRPGIETEEHGRAVGAILLCRAERHASDNGWGVTWELDDAPFDCDCGEDHGPAYGAVLRNETGDILGSLWGVTFATRHPSGDPYARVVAAELAEEAM